MKKKHCILNLGTVLGLTLSLSLLTGCAQMTDPIAAESTAVTADTVIAEASKAIEAAETITIAENTELSAGGVLFLKVNPEIAITYDADGKVTKVDARNDDGSKIIADYTGFVGKETKKVVSELVTKIGDAGYFVEEIDGNTRKIVIEVESGSRLPNEAFLDEVIAEVKACVEAHDWKKPLDYDVTDYGTSTAPESTPSTPTESTPTPKTEPTSNPAPAPQNNTDYHVTDYGLTNYDDNVTDYGLTNYDDNVTDYGLTNYDDSKTDYDTTDYDTTDYGKSDYDD